MIELKKKTVQELRKIASRKKIEGRSEMNKAELVRALNKKKSTTKKTMKGGALTEHQINMLVERNYQRNPLNIDFGTNRRQIVGVERRSNNFIIVNYIFDERGGVSGVGLSYRMLTLEMNETGNPVLLRVIPEEIAPVPAPVPVPVYESNLVNINAKNPNGILTHNDGQCAICLANTRFKENGNKIPYTNTERRQMLIKLKPCGHVFHRDCINDIRTQLCPLCRTPFRP